MLSSKMTFEELVNAIQTEISRRKSRSRNNTTVHVLKANNVNNSSGQRNNHDKNSGHIRKDKWNGAVVCWVCERYENRSKDCYYRADKRRVHNQGFKGSNRGGRGHGLGGLKGRNRFYREKRRYGTGRGVQQSNHHEQFFLQSANPSNDNGIQLANQANVQTSTPSTYYQADQGGFKAPGNSPYGFMAQIKFKNTIAKCGMTKSKDWLIDFGASHHFCNDKKFFTTYELTQTTQVQAASELSVLVSKGQIYIHLAGGIFLDAYHAPYFQTNIISGGMLTESLNVNFTKDQPARNNLSTCLIYERSTKRLCNSFEICPDGLYRIKGKRIEPHQMQEEDSKNCKDTLFCNKCVVFSGRKLQSDLILEWHNRTGHPNPNRYLRLSAMRDDVPMFPRKVLENLLCVPCRLAKMQRRAILPSKRITIRPLELVHMDITGKMSTASLGNSSYGIGFVDDFSAKSDVYFLQ